MTNRKLTALMLAGALALGLCGGAVLAADPVEPDTSAVEQTETAQEDPQASTPAPQAETRLERQGPPSRSILKWKKLNPFPSA